MGGSRGRGVLIGYFQIVNLFCSGCNVCRLNSEHQLLAIGTEEVRKNIVSIILRLLMLLVVRVRWNVGIPVPIPELENSVWLVQELNSLTGASNMHTSQVYQSSLTSLLYPSPLAPGISTLSPRSPLFNTRTPSTSQSAPPRVRFCSLTFDPHDPTTSRTTTTTRQSSPSCFTNQKDWSYRLTRK